MIGTSRRMVVLAVAGTVAIAPVISGCGAGNEPQSAAPTQLTDGVNASIPKDQAAQTQIALRNMFLLGPRPEEPVPAGSSLALYGVVINMVKGRQDRLVSVSSPLFGTPKIDGGGLVLPPATQDGIGSPVKLLGKASQPPKTQQPARSPQAGASPSESPQAGGSPSERPSGATAPTTPGATTSPPAGQQQAGPPVTANGEQALVVLTGLKQALLAGTPVPVRMQFEKAGAVDFQVPLIPQQGEFSTYPLASPVAQTPPSPRPGGGAQPSAGTEPARPGSSEHGTPQPGTSQPGTQQQPGASQPAGGGH